MISFENDYSEGAHPLLLEALAKTNFEQLSGYGTDKYTESAKAKIRSACGLSADTDVYLLSGGTQTNQVVISSLLGLCEGVIAAETGHINVHEAGAVEHTGHKVIPLPAHEGRLDAEELRGYLETYHADSSREHMVYPGMVYISYPTEYGTLYSNAQLAAIHEICREYGIPLFVDGARLGCGLMSRESDITLPELAALCDVFYIGGTKNGALMGEAVVFSGVKMPPRFVSIVKQHGAMLAKGRLAGVQFDALFTDDLYFDIGRHAIEMAERLKAIFAAKGYRFFLDSPTNQQFVILENEDMDRLAEETVFSVWEKFDNTHTVVRFATSWATTAEMLDRLEELL